MTKKIFALVMVVSVLGVFLVGCGSKTDDSAAAPAATAATAGTPAATAGTAPAATAGDTTK